MNNMWVKPFFLDKTNIKTLTYHEKSLTVTSKGLKFQIPNYNMNEKYIIPEVSNNAEWYLLTNRKSFITKEEENKKGQGSFARVGAVEQKQAAVDAQIGRCHE